MIAEPLVSVVIASYNRWPLVGDAIESALAATAEPYGEVVVVDDGSTDETSERVRQMFPTVRLITQANRERGAARNTGAAAAKGRYLNFLDSDDLLETAHVAQLAAHLGASQREGVVVAVPAMMWDPTTGAARPSARPRAVGPELKKLALMGTCLPLPGLFIPRRLFFEIGGFPEDRSVAVSEDWVLLARLAAAEADFEFVARPTVRMRVHGGRSMNDVDAVVRSRIAAMELVISEGLNGHDLTGPERALVVAGAHRLCASSYYGVGQMRKARQHIGRAIRAIGWFRGIRLTGRLWVQTLLGRRVSSRLREARHKSRRYGRPLDHA